MSLSNELVSQFVKITKDTNDEKPNTALYGTTVIEYDGRTYVKIDGSELLTPVQTTTSVTNGDRVMVTIENHTATITGNISDPSASSNVVKEQGDQITEFGVVVSHKVSTEELEAVNATIDSLSAKTANIENLDVLNADIRNLQAKYAELEYVDANTIKALNADIDNLQAKVAEIGSLSAEDLEAINADIDNLRAYNADFTYVSADVLTAIKASIKELDAKKISADELNVKYANIDFSNIGEAAIRNFYAQSGIIEDLVISDGHVTGTLVGVTIKGDLIEGGTVVADKLVIKGEDGLYYKLNTNGETISSEQTEYNSLSGTIITAKSITAEKVNVDDLVAFDATIGGFNITRSSLYSGVKESPLNTTRGVYLDSIGQIAFGDSDNFIRYYAGEDGRFRLEIAAENISLRTSGGVKDVEEVVKDSVSELGIGARNLIRNSRNLIFSDYYFDTGEYVDLDVEYIDSDGEVIVTTSNISSYDNGLGDVVVDSDYIACSDDGAGAVTVRFNSVAIDSISVVYNGGSVEAGTKLSSLGKDIVVTAHYANGKTAVVTDYTISGNTSVGTNVITVYYSGRVDTFNLECTQTVVLSSLSVSYDGGDVEVGTNVNALEKITVLARYSDGTTKEITDYTLVGEIKLGTNNITVKYGERTTMFSVVGKLSVIRIEATYNGGSVPTGTSLGALDDITVTATYSDNSTAVVTGYTLSGAINDGTNTITVEYEGKTTTFKVTGVKVVDSISAEYDGAFISAGSDISDVMDHITVHVHYKDGSSSLLTNYNISGNINAIGYNTMTISYEDKTTTVTVQCVDSRLIFGDTKSQQIAAWGNSITAPYTLTYSDEIEIANDVITLVNPKTITYNRTPSANEPEVYTTILGKYFKSQSDDPYVYYVAENSDYAHRTNVNAYVYASITYYSVQYVTLE